MPRPRDAFAREGNRAENLTGNAGESGVRWYHGGVPGLKRGQKILRPSETGAVSVADKIVSVRATPAEREEIARVHRPDRVYLARDVAVARFWASLAVAYGGGRKGGDVYEVTPDGPLEPDPDYLPDDGGSVCCASATIVCIVERRVPRPTPEQIAYLARVS